MAKKKGVDVSFWNGVIDFKKVKASGIDFVVLREGFRKTIDARFLEYAKGAIANSIPVMVYHFIYTDGATIKENAQSTVNNMKRANLDIANTYIWVDLEYDTWSKNGEKCTKERCSKYIREYIDELTKLGCKKIGIYTNIDYRKNYLEADLIEKYPIWLADYEGEPNYSCVLHQYTTKGKVDGINSTGLDMNYLYDESLITNKVATTTKVEEPTSTENELRKKVVDYVIKFMGVATGSTNHKSIVNTFNNSGLCTRYKMQYHDAWCATTVSAAFIANGLAGKPGSGSLFECVECSCQRMIELAIKQGIWKEDDSYNKAKTGDIILYDWNDSGYGDCTGFADHVGIIEKVSNGIMTVVEGNMGSGYVGRRNLAFNARYIRGFITPNYAKFSKPATTTTTTKPTTTTSTTTTITTTSTTSLKKGSEGSTVKTMQKMLIVCGYNCGSAGADGKFGSVTEKALKKFQTDFGLKADGIYGSKTKAKLTEEYKKHGKVTASSLNVRKKPGANNAVCTFSPLKKDTIVYVVNSTKAPNGDKWYYIKYNGKFGYVHSAWIKMY